MTGAQLVGSLPGLFLGRPSGDKKLKITQATLSHRIYLRRRGTEH